MKEFLKKILRIINKQISKVSNPLTIPDIGYRTKNTKVRIAVIGLGNQGSKLCHYLCKMGYNVVAICDFSRRKGYRIKKLTTFPTSICCKVDYLPPLHKRTALEELLPLA